MGVHFQGISSSFHKAELRDQLDEGLSSQRFAQAGLSLRSEGTVCISGLQMIVKFDNSILGVYSCILVYHKDFQLSTEIMVAQHRGDAI